MTIIGSPAIIAPGHISYGIAQRMKRMAETGTYSGQVTDAAGWRYMRRCTHDCPNTGARLIYTRDIGMHSSGWWKNPDYERCFHLSVSFVGVEQGIEYPLPQNRKTAGRWCAAIFGSNVGLLWVEPPFSEHGRTRDVWHYRLFADAAWLSLKPRGEVYSRDWTPADWKSWSDVHGTENGDGDFGRVIR